MNKSIFVQSNPFTLEHTSMESEFMKLPDMFHMDGKSSIAIDRPCWKAGMRQDCYMDVSTIPKEDFYPHRFLIDGKLWMSTVPREFCSQWIPLMQASGKVGVAGLGMGYFALRVASFDDVTEVVVHEINETVIEYFTWLFRDRPEMKKIRIVKGDFRVSWKQESFDYYFNDVYLSIGSTEGQLDHMQEAIKMDNIKKYWYWGFDHHLYECLKDGKMDALNYMIDQPYFKEFLKYRNDCLPVKETIFDKNNPLFPLGGDLLGAVDNLSGFCLGDGTKL